LCVSRRTESLQTRPQLAIEGLGPNRCFLGCGSCLLLAKTGTGRDRCQKVIAFFRRAGSTQTEAHFDFSSKPWEILGIQKICGKWRGRESVPIDLCPFGSHPSCSTTAFDGPPCWSHVGAVMPWCHPAAGPPLWIRCHRCTSAWFVSRLWLDKPCDRPPPASELTAVFHAPSPDSLTLARICSFRIRGH
jgi:hypothetical protein